MYEHKKQPLLTPKQFLFRLWYNLLVSISILAISIAIGILGFHYINHSDWIDSIHNACMLLGGMGPVVEMTSSGAKLFSSGYALFCGVVFITNIGVLLAPVIHRILHSLHMEDDSK
ncbi:hypothetical protein [Flavihumibacter fluvii]|uniref:hypothetical protein n=1 Tax=Flavihumibacter fluvii TaxID=2838157 RepID=UPI001BDDF0BE|nr:hypothetical protein [Flavihumibacter fluvii]ULQ51817.1 hypothetical protein KJS93_17145 [Flavihumibacter fluvii]